MPVLEMQPVRPVPLARSELCRIRRRSEDPADLGRDDQLVARLGPQNPPEPVLAERPAIEGRGVEVADAGVPRRLDCCLGDLVGQRPEEVADRRTAEAERREHDLGLAEAGAREGIHLRAPAGR